MLTCISSTPIFIFHFIVESDSQTIAAYERISRNMNYNNNDEGYVNPEDSYLLTVAMSPSSSHLLTLTCETFADPRSVELRLLAPLPIFNSSIGASRDFGRGFLTLDSHRRVVVLPPNGNNSSSSGNDGGMEVIGVWKKVPGGLNAAEVSEQTERPFSSFF